MFTTSNNNESKNLFESNSLVSYIYLE